MSGPITVAFTLDFGVLLLAQRALREARDMQREYGEVVDQLRRRETELAATRQGQRTARLERISATRREAARQLARIERLRILAGDVPGLAGRLPQAALTGPPENDDASWDEYLSALEGAAAELEALFAQTGGAFGKALLETLAPAAAGPSIHDVLSAYVLQRQHKAGLDAAQADRFRETAARVLARLDLAQDEAVPTELEALARAIVLAPSVERAEALASELRLAVQKRRDAQAAQANESAAAQRLLAELPEDAPEALARALERVAAGVERLDPALRKSAQDVLDTTAADRAGREHEAAAFVLEQSLRDLGYEVDDIEATLIADGGVVHFTRPGWENYFVRLRFDPRAGTANFNVVRASGDEDTPERRRLDALAEDRWCAEFPRLMETLAARGIRMEVTRRLGAGEVPVQVVAAESLPRTQAAERKRPRRGPQARRTP